MHSNRLNSKIIYFILAVSLLMPCDILAGKANESAAIESSRNLLKLLSAKDNQAVNPLLDQWSDHLQAISTYSNSCHIEAFTELQKEYSDLIAQMEDCMTDPPDGQKRYDPSWVDKLINHFGPVYLKDKEKIILANLRMAVASDTEGYCGAIMEKLLFKEAVLFGAYRYYLNLFLDFYKLQPPAKKNILRVRKDAAESFLKLINKYSFEKLLIGDDMPRKKLSEIEAKNADEAIYNYFKANPIGYDTDPFAVLEDFRKAIKDKP